ALRLRGRALIAGDGEDVVHVGVAEHERTRGAKGDHRVEVPAVGVDEVHAVAVPGDDALAVAGRHALDHVGLQVGEARDGDDALHTIVSGRDPTARHAAARAARGPQAFWMQ